MSDLKNTGNITGTLSLLKGDKGESAFECWLQQEGNEGKSFDDFMQDLDVDSSNFATKEYVSQEIIKIQTGGGVNLDDYAKLTDIPTKTSQLENDSNFLTSIPTEYITETELNAKGYLTEHQDISGLATKSELHSHGNKSVLDSITANKVNSWDNKADFDGNYNNLTNKPTIPTVDVNKNYVDTQLSTKADKSEIPSLEGYATESYVADKIAEASLSGGEVDLSGYATKDELDKKANISSIPTKTSQLTNDSGFLTSHQDISGKANKTYVDEELAKKANVSHTHSYNDLTDKPSIPSIDGLTTKTYVDTQLAKKSDKTHNHDTSYAPISHTHDQYLTEHQDLSGYALKTEIPTVPTKTSQITNDSGFLTSIPTEYVTEIELNAKGYLTEHIDISGKANISDLASVATSGDYNDLTNKPTIPTKTSQLTNDNLQSITDDNLTTTNKTIVGAINELKSYVSNGKTLIASAITDKGVETSSTDTFEVIANNISKITTGASNTGLILSYGFNDNVVGSAYGDIALIGNNSSEVGEFFIYYSNDNEVLSDYDAIATLNLVSSNSLKTFSMIEENLIPYSATKIVAVQNGEVKAEYEIPTTKRTMDESDKLYSFGLLSDIHVDGDGTDETLSNSDLQRALQFFENYGVVMNVVTGDATWDGNSTDVKNLKTVLSNYTTKPYYIVRGNHDVRHECADLTYWTNNVESNGLYFSVRQGNDVFLFVGMANDDYSVVFTTEELDWLEEQLETYKNQRVFVLEHVFVDPVGNVCNLYPWSGFLDGELPNRFKSMLSFYKNVVLCTGHSHFDFKLQRLEDTANINKRNDEMCNNVHVPSCAYPRRKDENTPNTSDYLYGYNEGSQGYVVDVYENKVVFKGYDFAIGKYIPIAQYVLDTTPITINSNYEEVSLNWTLNQTISSSTGKVSSGDGNAVADVITIDSNYDYFISTTSDVEYLAMYCYGASGYIGRFGNPTYISETEGSYYSGTLNKYKLPVTSETTSFRLRVAILKSSGWTDDSDSINRISLFRKLK